MPLATPIVFLIFNRPELTEIVFKAISEAQPKKLLVVADGPRLSEENERCDQARAIIRKTDWDCEVLTNFADSNLGCKHRVSSGLDWVFGQVEEAIILEDDCLPAPSFFQFCEELLLRYRHDERIMHISGDNFQNGQSRTKYSYYFSRYVHVWGWASWRRAWQHYDVEMKAWPEHKETICSSLGDASERTYWADIFDRVHAGQIDSWAYQWLYACWSQSGLAIAPNSNLVSNIGFGADGTHTRDQGAAIARLPTADIWEMKHPQLVLRNPAADEYSFNHIFGGNQLKQTYLGTGGFGPLSKSTRTLVRKALKRLTRG